MYTMVEWRTAYYTPIDREYHTSTTQTPDQKGLEEPIYPIRQLGETVPEQDQQGRNILQTTQAAIRGGAGTLQLVMTVSHEAAIGGRFKSYGKDVREALRETIRANQVDMKGVELPTSLKNLSGFDYQQNAFSEDARKRGLDEVKDAIKFTADVMRGGGIDLVSWEFPRTINEQKFAKDDKGKPIFERDTESEKFVWLVDDRSGRTARLSKEEKQHLAFDKETFKPIAPTSPEERVKLNDFIWDDFQKWAKKNQERVKTLTEEDRKKAEENGEILATSPEQILVDVQLNAQINSLRGQSTRYQDLAEQPYNKMIEQKNLANQETDPEEKQKYEKEARKYEELYKDYMRSVEGSEQQIKDLEERKTNYKTIQDYGIKKSAISYAEAGITAMQQTEQMIAEGKPRKDLYVGPEIGWPDYFGSHPDEFIELIEKSRQQMVKMLTSKTLKDFAGNDITSDGRQLPKGQKPVQNRFYNEKLTPKEAEKHAENHVKGLFDTSHMGMWLSYFKPNPGENEDARIKRFNTWFTDQVEKIASKPGLVGGIQLVDSQSAAHGHLPPGEGIFPVIETAKIFKEKGYKGFLVSEGHEEEKFGVGRIRTKTWERFNAPIGSGYFGAPTPQRWRNIEHGYFGKTYSPLFMFGSYAPSAEFKLWSEVPLE